MRLSRTLKNSIRIACCSLALASSVAVAQPPREGEGGREGGRGEGRGERGGERGPEGGRGRFGFGGGPGGGPGMFMMRMPVMAALDADGNGEISTAEIDGAVAALKKLDKNGDGKLTMEELMPEGGPMGGGFGGGPDPAEMVNRMMANDKNSDGVLEKDELPERMQQMFARADADGDGKLTKEELTKVAGQMGRGRGEGGRGGEGRGEGGRGEGPRGGEGTRPQRPTSE